MRLRRQAFTAVVAALFCLGGALGVASTAEASGGSGGSISPSYGSGGYFQGPWSCGPDMQAGISVNASGPISIDAYISSPLGGGLTGAYFPSGHGVVWAQGRSVYWWEYGVSNGGRLTYWGLACR